MKRFILKSTSFTGQVDIVYAERLRLVDFSDTDLKEVQQQYILKRIPSTCNTEDDLKEALQVSKAKDLSVIMTDYDVTFEMFWDAYKYKRNKERAQKAWNRCSALDRCLAYEGTKRYNYYCQTNTWYNKKLAENYLSERLWENEWTS